MENIQLIIGIVCTLLCCLLSLAAIGGAIWYFMKQREVTEETE